MSNAAEFQNVRVSFDDFVAVDGIDLNIPAGKFTTLLGPSGCGKTTSLRMLAGYQRLDSGKILIDGEDSTNTPPEKRNLGMVFQSYALFPHMSISENVEYGLKLRRVEKSERRRRAAEALEMVGLASQAAKRPKQLSGGQQQRVAIARAVAIRPKLLLLDEPLSNLDARLRIQMRSELRRIQRETGLSVVLVTHDQDEALEMSDQMVVMSQGRVQQQGAPTEVFPRPANRFVAEFMGYENFISTSEGKQLTIRPEHLALVEEAGAAGEGMLLDASLTGIAYRGVDCLLTVQTSSLSGEPTTLIANVRAEQASGLSAGDQIKFFAPSHNLVTLAN